jgi:hypothetical protein
MTAQRHRRVRHAANRIAVNRINRTSIATDVGEPTATPSAVLVALTDDPRAAIQGHHTPSSSPAPDARRQPAGCIRRPPPAA